MFWCTIFNLSTPIDVEEKVPSFKVWIFRFDCFFCLTDSLKNKERFDVAKNFLTLALQIWLTHAGLHKGCQNQKIFCQIKKFLVIHSLTHSL
jgi:hypothetical protein